MKQIGDILDLSKIESGHIELECVPFAFREMILECVRIMASKAETGRLVLVADLPDELPEIVEGDRIRLQQVLLNLISNAIKFTPPGGRVGISVTHAIESSGELRIQFEVADTGIGMSPEAVAKFFDRFSQAAPSVARNYGGTGLGLSISFQLVELLGGRLEVESQPGHGSRFFFAIPLQLAWTDFFPNRSNSSISNAPCDRLRPFLRGDAGACGDRRFAFTRIGD